MTRDETIKLLALIKVAYPSAYRDMDKENKYATVAMWHATFSCVPYAAMEMAFEKYRLQNKFPPSVAEMVDAIRDVHFKAMFEVNAGRGIGDEDMWRRAAAVLKMTDAFMRERLAFCSAEQLDGDVSGRPLLEQFCSAEQHK